MGLVNFALPILQAVGTMLEQRKESVAEKTGLSVETVGKVSGVVNDLLTKDERVAGAIMAEIDRARAHDTAMMEQATPFVTLLRGLVRPVITLTAFFWYVYARCTGLPMSGEDYAIVGGIMAFWFGLRPFEKHAADKGVAAMPNPRGK